MYRIAVYSLLLVVGMLAAQVYNLNEYRSSINTLTMLFLGYIMIEVGLEFLLDKKNLRAYGRDFVVALSAAVLP